MKLQTLNPRLATVGPRLSRPAGIETERLRGSAAVKRRLTFLRSNPLCCRCTKEGKTGAATTPDHKVPLWAGGEDNLDTNGNALCDEHHDAKTKCEARMRAAGGWLSTPCSCGQHDA